MHRREGHRVFLEYREAVKEWVASINELESGHPQELLARIEEGRFCAELAKEDYLKHIREHGCAAWTGT